MNVVRLLALAAIICASTLNTVQGAGHPNRPLGVPELSPGLTILYVNGDGDVVASESGSGPTINTLLVFGWSFDPNDPNSAWVQSSPTYSRTNLEVTDNYSNGVALYAFNSSTLQYANLNRAELEQFPNFLFGPSSIQMLDLSRLEVANSVIGNVTLLSGSSATISDTQIGGQVLMISLDQLALTNVSPFPRGDAPPLFVNAFDGTTQIDGSTVHAVSARGTAQILIKDSSIKQQLNLTDTAANSALVTVSGNSSLGKITASAGGLLMQGGEVKGLIEAFGSSNLSFGDTSVLGSPTARGKATVSFTNANIQGNLSVGDGSSDEVSTIAVAGGHVNGVVQTVGHGRMELAGMQNLGESLGLGGGTAAQAHDASTLSMTGVGAVFGSVVATDNSTLILDSVRDIFGDLSVTDDCKVQATGLENIAGRVRVSGNVKLELSSVSAAGVDVFNQATLNMTGGDTLNALVFDGTLNLKGVNVSEEVTAFGGSHLTFAAGSQTGRDIVNVGNETGLVSVTGGDVGGNLIGFASSITAMSGGHVVGFPVFQDRAKFLYSGGTFDFFGVPQASAALKSGLTVASGAGEGGPGASLPLPGFTAMGDAEIQFIGHELQSTLIDPNFFQDDVSYSVYQLTGHLADGTPINGGLVYVENGFTARFSLVEAPVPEPSSLALLLMAMCASGMRFEQRRRAAGLARLQ